MRFNLRNDYKAFGYFHVLPELELSVSPDGRLRYIRMAFLTHELYIDIHKE